LDVRASGRTCCREAGRDNAACLANAYKLRMQQLSAVIADIASRGPFPAARPGIGPQGKQSRISEARQVVEALVIRR
jgi:hypothetical protein